jgi:hypothetical protein
VSQEDNNLIDLIADRTEAPLVHSIVIYYLKMVHYEICPLRLKDLFAAPKDEFNAEMDGVHFYIDILNGSFREGWWPKFAQKPRGS